MFSYWAKSFFRNLFLILFIISILVLPIYSQVSGTYTLPGEYPTIKSAIAAINASGVGNGGVTFNVATGYTESFSSSSDGLITATGTGQNKIVFQKAGSGINPVITAGSGTGTLDGIITLAGTDYITFDGIDIKENVSNTTLSLQMEWGYALLKKNSTAPFNGCQHVVIKNCTVTLTQILEGSSEGIHISNHTPSSSSELFITDASDANSYNIIDHNILQNCLSGIVINGYNAPEPYTLSDQENIISNCVIQNFGGTIYPYYSVFSYGIYSANQINFTVLGNSINNKEAGGTYHTNTIYGIKNNAGSNFTARLNNITLDCSYHHYGLWNSSNGNIILSSNTFPNFLSTQASTHNFNVYFIYNIGSGASVSIDSNSIGDTNLGYPNSAFAIYNSSATPDVKVRNNTISNLLTQSDFYGYYNTGISLEGNELFVNNSIRNINTGTYHTEFSVWAFLSSSNNSKEIKNNIFSNIASVGYVYGITCSGGGLNNVFNNILDTLSSSLRSVTAIYLYNCGVANIYSNNIFNISSTCDTALVSAINIGRYYPNISDSANIFNNKISDISVSKNTASVRGISIDAGKVYIYNNFISDLRAPIASGNAVTGLSFNYAGSVNAYYNTIFLNAISSGNNFGSSGIYSTTSFPLDIRNNIVVNSSTPSGTGKTVAFRRGNTNLTNYSNTSDGNDFYAGIPGTANLIFFDGTNMDQTISDFKTRVSPRDIHSVSENAPFLNSITPPFDLHISSIVSTNLDGGAIPINYPIAIITDIDGETRNSTIPDIGADEFAGITPVELSSLIVTPENNNVVISWETKSELNSKCFLLERSTDLKLWNNIGEVKAMGNTLNKTQYSFIDHNVGIGRVHYKLRIIDLDGTELTSEVITAQVNLPVIFNMSQNYPNPFNPSTKIQYQLPVASKVIIDIYSVTGEKVFQLLNIDQQAGYYTIDLNSSGKLSSGIYIYRLTTGEFSQSRKMLLLK